MICRRILAMVLLAGGGFWFASAGGPVAPNTRSELMLDEQTLKTYGIATDGPGLLEYFKRRTPSAEQQANLKKRASQLGSTAFPLRSQATDELIRAGRPALPYLREIASK